jgi:hypothetical protein
MSGMLRILIIYLISYCCFSGFAASQAIPPSSTPIKHTQITARQSAAPQNFMVVDSLMSWAVGDMQNAMPSLDTAQLKIKSHPADWLLESHILEAYAFTSWRTEADKEHTQLNINIRNCGVQLFNHPESQDSLLRTVEVSFSAQAVSSIGVINSLGTITHQYSDVLARVDVLQVQNTPHIFAVAQVPEAERGFFDEVIEPLVVAGALVVTVVLLFTVRSQ